MSREIQIYFLRFYSIIMKYKPTLMVRRFVVFFYCYHYLHEAKSVYSKLLTLVSHRPSEVACFVMHSKPYLHNLLYLVDRPQLERPNQIERAVETSLSLLLHPSRQHCGKTQLFLLIQTSYGVRDATTTSKTAVVAANLLRTAIPKY